MTANTFFEKFDLFADAPNAVAKMRELVLQLAVQGKLIDQVPSFRAMKQPPGSSSESRNPKSA